MPRHEYACHVRFSDVDVYGHVNNVKYFEYYQEARLAFLSTLREQEASDIALVVARMDVDYMRPIRFRPEPYVVASRVTRVGRSSFTLAADVMDGGKALSRSEAVLVAYDLTTQRSRPWTEPERAILEAAVVD
ncbi:thioesterase family protein [soil metagenome]